MSNITINEGRVHAMAVANDPFMPFTLYPIYMAELMAITPGTDCTMASMSMNSVSVIHPLASTTSFCMSGSMAYPPPMVNMPMRKKL